MRRLSPFSLLPLLLCAWPCVAQNQDYLPLSRAETSRRFPVKLLGETGGGRPGSFGVVADSAAGREVVTVYGDGEAAKALLEAAVKAKSAVTLYGRRSAEGCSPEWVWLRR
jgi:hypothetical protein